MELHFIFETHRTTSAPSHKIDRGVEENRLCQMMHTLMKRIRPTLCLLRRRGLSEQAEVSALIGEELFRQQQENDYSGSAWGTFAEQYDRSFAHKFQRYANAVMDGLQQRSPETAADGERLTLLDIGCGTGLSSKVRSQARHHVNQC